jgi:hypothetical protein
MLHGAPNFVSSIRKFGIVRGTQPRHASPRFQ